MAHKGYNRKFLGETIAVPKLPTKEIASVVGGVKKEIKYINYSSYQHKERKLPFMTVVNIKGEGYNAPTREGTEPWDFSTQVAEDLQLDGRFYGNDQNTFDRGHLVRRIDPCWGSDAVVDEAEKNTFVWTNCTPQHKKLNQKGGVWYQLEQHVMENGVKNKMADVTVFAGPVLNKDDKAMLVTKGFYKGQYIQIPIEFWKIIVWKKSNGKFYAVGFLMSQWEFIKTKLVDMPAPVTKALFRKKAKAVLADDYFEQLKFADHQTYQVPISAIEKKTGIKFNWSNVSFSYKAKKPKAVGAKAQKKQVAFADVYKAKTGNNKTGLVSKSSKKQKSITPVIASLSSARISKAVKHGYAGAVKRYQLTNITL
jgi:endonuclease G, mitochondrial